MIREAAGKILVFISVIVFVLSILGIPSHIARGADLNIGDTVEVTENLNVRTNPGTSYPEITTDPDYPGYAPAGTRGQIIGGPTSADGYTWWQVNYGPGLYSGWSVEGGLEKIAQSPDPPDLNSPSGSGQSLTPLFQWSSVSNADSYGLYVSKPPYGPSNLVYENEGLTGTSLSLPAGILEEGVTYYWNMRSYNSAGWGGFSSSSSFTTQEDESIQVIDSSPSSLSFSATQGGSNPANQTLSILNSGDGTLSWSVSDDAGWLSLSPTSGTSTGETDAITVSTSISGMGAGTYDAVITITASGASNSPQSVPVTLTINTNSDIVTFPDSNLEAAIRDTLGKSSGDITKTELGGMTALSSHYTGISNLSGLEHCINLRELDLRSNSITDINPLAGLPLLYLLNLTDNQITDISALDGLPALKLVYLGSNQISNVSPLGGLPYLQRVVLFSNQVSDISPLVQNTGIGSDEEVDLRTNPLSEVSIGTYIPQLQSRGVDVLYDSSISILCDPVSLAFNAVDGANNPAGQTISVWCSGAGSDLNWAITEDADWLTVFPTAGTSTGEQDTVTVSVDIAGLDSGLYQTDIVISAAGATNSPQTIPVILNITEAGKPDLIIESITYLPQSPSIGDTVTFTVTLKNQGSGVAYSSKCYYLIDDVQKGYDYANSLEPGATTTETFTWSAQEGQHAIKVVADYDGNVSESDENNNEKTITYSATAFADLIISEITWEPANPSSGDTVTFTVTTKNQGNGEAVSSKVYYFIDNTQKEYDYVSSLKPGETTAETFNWSAQDGQHVIKAIADHQNSISESDENNNEKSVTLSIGEEIISTPSKPSGNTDCNTRIEYGYSTGGAASSCGHDIEYRFDWGDGNYSGWSPSTSEYYSWSDEGDHIVKAQARCATHTDVISDWSPGLTVYVEASQEISAEIVDYDATPDELETGDDVHLYLDILNTGNTPWQFYAAASLRKPDGEEVHLPMKAVSINQGESGRAIWNYSIGQEGEWDVVFGIWNEKEKVTPQEHTGWLNSFINCDNKNKEDTGYSIYFDLRNMLGFDDEAITAYDIQAYIAQRYPLSPMLIEEDIGGIFISAGMENGVNPAFLVSTAELEGRFGTAGWGAANPEAHNTMGWGVYSPNANVDSINSADTWGAMVVRVAYYIAHGNLYYGDGKYTVDQIRRKYAAEPNSESIISLMEGLYAFGVENPDIDIEQTNLEQLIQQQAIGGTPVTVDGKLYIILTLNNMIDPNTLEVIEDSGTTKLYVYGDRNIPVTDRATVQKIALVDYVNKLKDDKLNRYNLAETNEDISNKILLLSSIQFAENSISLIAAVPTSLTLKALAELLGGEASKVVFHKLQEMQQELLNNLAYAQDSNNRALHKIVRNKSGFSDYDTAREVLLDYLSGISFTERYSFLYGMLYGRYPGGLEALGRAGEIILREFTYSVSDELLGGEIEEDYEAFCKNADDKLELDLSRLYEAASYTLKLTNSPRITSVVHSPVELRVYDSTQRITGIVNGEEMEEIPYSVYDEDGVTIFFPEDIYRYEVTGTDKGSYDLVVTSIAEETKSLSLLEVSTSAKAVHEYTFDWDMISEGDKGVTMKIDSEGDGDFERVINLFGIEDKKGGLSAWIWICIGIAIGLAVVISLGIWRYSYSTAGVKYRGDIQSILRKFKRNS